MLLPVLSSSTPSASFPCPRLLSSLHTAAIETGMVTGIAFLLLIERVRVKLVTLDGICREPLTFPEAEEEPL